MPPAVEKDLALSYKENSSSFREEMIEALSEK